MSVTKELKRRLDGADLSGTKVRVALSADETQTYTFNRLAGSGQKAITWKVVDRFGWPFALKFVSKAEYYSHSIDFELHKVRELGVRFAQIRFYGEPQLEKPGYEFLTKETYAVIVEWVEGQTFSDFCAQEGESLEVSHFLSIAREFCEVLALLKARDLSHGDLHDGNVMVVKECSGLSSTYVLAVRVIDTGSLMTNEFLASLIEKWRNEQITLQQLAGTSPEAAARAKDLAEQIAWFSRGDQSWVVAHLCSVVNQLRRNDSRLPISQRKFLRSITPILAKMIDHDASMRLENPVEMFLELDMLWKSIVTPQSAPLLTPFDLISAELIRSNDQLNHLFSDKCPWLERCATTDPVYIYGPRGCGKSTILRKLSLPAVLSSPNARSLFSKWPYVGVYISCSSELRSRFWLFPKESYPDIQADVLLFFTILLTEALLEVFELLRDGEVERTLGESVGLTKATEQSISEVICTKFELPEVGAKLGGVSWFTYVRKKLAIKRNEVWKTILTMPIKKTPNPALLFDLCKDLERVFPLLKEKHIAFLIDDYSNQRIPVELQRMLNQTISFAKQGNPIFKVSSEYQGVDLEGIQEGREVVEVNFGKEYVDLTESRRSMFLEDVLDIRFRQAKVSTTIEMLLGKSGVSPGIQMAREIRRLEKSRESFCYHGIDTIADICSGDLAMALDLVKKIYVTVKDKLPLAEPVSPAKQNELIHEYSDREHSYNRYFPMFGKEIAEIADRLCWLSHEATLHRDSVKHGKPEPMIKTHIDIPLAVARELPEKMQALLHEMQRKGVLFCLDTSRSRIENDGTERYQVRRILLVRYRSPLGRRDPIKMDNVQKLLHLLQDPQNFVRAELAQDGVTVKPDEPADPRQGSLPNI